MTSQPLDGDRRPRRALEALNFFMADVQAGLGPFLGVFLQQRRWTTGNIGLVMTLGGLAGMLVAAPAGALVDATRRKRLFFIVSGVCTVAASAVVWFSQSFVAVAASQIGAAVAGAAILPAVAGMTLGIVRQRGFARQNGRNQAFNHAGNLTGAALSGLLGWRFGFGAVFLVIGAFGVFSIATVLLIPRRAIDDRAARGLEDGANETDGETPKGLRVLLESRPLLALSGCLGLFHLGNAAMLPLYGLAVVGAHKGDPAAFTAMTIVVAQGVMILASLLAMRMADKPGYWWIMMITFIALPVRGLVAASVIQAWGVWPVQALDGVGAGLQSVAVPGLVARLLAGTGRVNVGQGAVMTVQGVGAALSPALGGLIAQNFGYSAAFLCLGSLALGSVALWLVFAREVKRAEARAGQAAA